MTKKLLVTFDESRPESRSTDFAVPLLYSDDAGFWGLKSKRLHRTGLVAYVGKEINARDLFARLVDSGVKIDSVEQTLRDLEHYVAQLQEFRIGNLLTVERSVGGFKLTKLASSPSSNVSKKLP